jgi:hypothetical protein
MQSISLQKFSVSFDHRVPASQQLVSEASPEACHGPGTATAWETGVILGLGNCFNHNTVVRSAGVMPWGITRGISVMCQCLDWDEIGNGTRANDVLGKSTATLERCIRTVPYYHVTRLLL